MRNSEHCAGHASEGFGANPQLASRKSAELRRQQAQVRKLTVREALARRAEELADKIVAAYERGLDSGDAMVAVRSADALLNRVFGKPKETVEQQVAVPRTVEALTAMTPEERRQLLIQLEAEGRMPMLRALDD